MVVHDIINLSFSFMAISFAEGRLRHKYFKDYKDYLGKWDNVDNLKTRIITESEISANPSDTSMALFTDRYQFEQRSGLRKTSS